MGNSFEIPGFSWCHLGYGDVDQNTRIVVGRILQDEHWMLRRTPSEMRVQKAMRHYWEMNTWFV